MKTETGMMKVVLMACATLCASAAALAEDAMTLRTETVKYSRTEAATPTGAVKLYGALKRAASRACSDAGTRLSAYGDAHEECKGAAVSRAVADVQIDAVTAVYVQDTGMEPKAGIVTVARR